MYHVTTDWAFPYRVCSGQTGSVCRQPLDGDGEITFHDWHPVNIQEYGIAAPDPKDPDNISLYNRHTARPTYLAPTPPSGETSRP